MDLLSWTAAAYLLLLPAGYTLEAQDTKKMEGPGGLGSAVETSCTWRNASGQTVAFHWWRPYPPYPGGPMVAVREARGTWAGASATFVETSVFQGRPTHSTVAFQEVARLDAHARITATGIELESLQELLTAASLRDLTPAQASEAGCGVLAR
jgi:hypothetical protein